eukprot:7211304-Heterocapsa_arctica.AAC.1
MVSFEPWLATRSLSRTSTVRPSRVCRPMPGRTVTPNSSRRRRLRSPTVCSPSGRVTSCSWPSAMLTVTVSATSSMPPESPPRWRMTLSRCTP